MKPLLVLLALSVSLSAQTVQPATTQLQASPTLPYVTGTGGVTEGTLVCLGASGVVEATAGCQLLGIDTKTATAGATTYVAGVGTQAACTPDNTLVTNDYITQSSSAPSQCHDNGTSKTNNIGQVVNGSAALVVLGGGLSGGGGSGSGLLEQIGFTADGAGATIQPGVKGSFVVPYAATITGWSILSTDPNFTSGSAVLDVWKVAYSAFPPTSANSITASAPITLSSSNKATSSALTGWTTSVNAGDILTFSVTSATSVTRLTLTLTLQRN